MDDEEATSSRDDITMDGYEVTDEDEIAAINYELQQIETELQILQDRKVILQQRKDKLRDDALLKKSLTVQKKDWDAQTFAWSKRLNKALVEVFKIKHLREYQLPTMNAILSGEDVILIMPTGGGKSLCYQLPAYISDGVTIVISPLIALMEDQLFSLHKLNVNAKMLSARANKDDVTYVMAALTDPNSTLRLIYITPEYMQRSKRFMGKLQKCYEMGKLDRFAIDEVHCCSTWGHDFRPDYKIVNQFKVQFPGVPIMGLTATAPAKIIVDVQKMCDIQGCLVFRANFNRPNLYYEVRRKPQDKEQCLRLLEDLLKNKFEGQSGIIYTTTQKDCEVLATDLRNRGLKVGYYHANLEPDYRSKTYTKWMSGHYQAVVATIAFGLGIDKPDVRFVIHHCLSKSMENFYQESGRAGRDGKKATCIVLYRLGDVFKLSPMVSNDVRVAVPNLYQMIKYCLNQTTCRRTLIAKHFEESWTADDCKQMCDHCKFPKEVEEIDVGPYCRSLYQIMANAVERETKLTALKLMDAWFNKGPANLRVATVPTPRFSRESGEAIVGHLLTNGFFKEEFIPSSYSTIPYIKRGPRAGVASCNNYRIPFKYNLS